LESLSIKFNASQPSVSVDLTDAFNPRRDFAEPLQLTSLPEQIHLKWLFIGPTVAFVEAVAGLVV